VAGDEAEGGRKMGQMGWSPHHMRMVPSGAILPHVVPPTQESSSASERQSVEIGAVDFMGAGVIYSKLMTMKFIQS
jgi:hypothetical protein